MIQDLKKVMKMVNKRPVQKGQLYECVFAITIQKRFTFTAPLDISKEALDNHAKQLAGNYRIRDASENTPYLNLHVAPQSTFQKG